MTVDQMREAIYQAYDGNKWRLKVKSMHDPQVIAVYHNLKKYGKLEKRSKGNPKEYQLSMFD